MKNLFRTLLLTIITSVTLKALSTEVLSSAIVVNTQPNRNRCWSTLFTNKVNLSWNWQGNATSAQLKIVGMNTGLTKDFTSPTTSCLWQPFNSTVPSDEDVYDLTLTFRDSGDAIIGALTSQLAVVTGAFGETAMDPDPASSAWGKVKKNVVIPYDSAWLTASETAESSQLEITGESKSQITSAGNTSGYFGWKSVGDGWGFGTFNLSLTFPGTVAEWAASLLRPFDGTLIMVR